MEIDRSIPSKTMQYLTGLRDQFENVKASTISMNEKIKVYENLSKEIEEKFDIEWIRKNSYNRSIDYRLDAALKLHQIITEEIQRESELLSEKTREQLWQLGGKNEYN